MKKMQQTFQVRNPEFLSDSKTAAKRGDLEDTDAANVHYDDEDEGEATVNAEFPICLGLFGLSSKK